MTKTILKNDSHIFQMLGAFDDRHGYRLPADLAEILIKMPKTLTVSRDEIDVGANIAFFTADLGLEFCLENSTLFLVERAAEMGGVVAYTYLVPLAEVTLDYFKGLDANIDLAPLKDRIKKRRAQHTAILAEHERLARGAVKKLGAPDVEEYKRFIRRGKPDFCCAQLQYIEQTAGENEVIERWKTACGNKTAAMLLAEPEVELFDPKIPETRELKKSTGGKGKKFNIRALLAAITKQDKPKKQPVRLKPSANAAKILNAEHEVEHPFAAEEIETQQNAGTDPGSLHTETSETVSEDEMQIQQTVAQLLRSKEPKAVAAMLEASLKGMKRAPKEQRAPEPLNRENEQ